MNVRKFCKCGVKLERAVADEDAAREVVEEFRRAHNGHGHGPASEREYLQVVSQIVARNAKSNRPRQAKPLLTEIAHAESRQGRAHIWVDPLGVVFCSTCLIIKTHKSIGTYCGGMALMKPSEFVGYPLPWFVR